jgi:hypothetical protein
LRVQVSPGVPFPCHLKVGCNALNIDIFGSSPSGGTKKKMNNLNKGLKRKLLLLRLQDNKLRSVWNVGTGPDFHCRNCGRPIPKGEWYYFIFEPGWGTYRFCINCFDDR